MIARACRALLLVSAAAVGAVSVGAPARAQFVVTDPAHTVATTQGWILQFANMVKSLANEARMLTNQGTQIAYDVKKYVELVRTADAVIHGNYYAITALIPELQELGLIDPWDADAASLQELFTGMRDLLGSASAIAGEANGLRNAFQFYRPGGHHYGAMSLNGAAAASAIHVAAANRMMRAAQDRARRISALKGRIGASADVTDAANAGARVGLETATNTAQTNMILSSMMNQGGQRDVRELQARAAWLASVEQLQADAETAYADAMAGQVNWQTGTGIRRVNYSVPAGGAADTAEPTAGAGAGAPYAYAPGSGDTLGLMRSRDWGDAAEQAAAARGITPEALSSLCRIESNCTDVGARTGSTIQGPWQMTAATSSAAAARAGLSGYDNSDPAQQATAAAEEMRSIGARLQAAGIEPTALNVRAGYQWGAAYAISLNTASPETPMSSALPSYSAATLARNGVANMTVGQWRASVAGKLGASANSSIFPGAST